MKKTISALVITGILALNFVNAQDNDTTAFKSSTDSLSYSFGLLIGNNLKMQNVTDINPQKFLEGMEHGLKSDTTRMTLENANTCVQDYFNKQMEQEAKDNLDKSAKFLEENKTKEGVVSLESGLQYKILQKGEGESPSAEDTVTVNYTGTLIDGTMFDSSVERGKPVTFPVNRVIPGWTEALQLMKPGSIWILYIPPYLAYGDQGAGGVIGPNQALIFQVELISVTKAASN